MLFLRDINKDEEWIVRRTWQQRRREETNYNNQSKLIEKKEMQKKENTLINFVENTFDDHFANNLEERNIDCERFNEKNNKFSSEQSNVLITLGVHPDRLLDLREVIDCVAGHTVAHFTNCIVNTLTYNSSQISNEWKSYLVFDDSRAAEKFVRLGTVCFYLTDHTSSLYNENIYRFTNTFCNMPQKKHKIEEVLLECCFLSAEDDSFAKKFEDVNAHFRVGFSEEKAQNTKSVTYNMDKEKNTISVDSDRESDADVQEVIVNNEQTSEFHLLERSSVKETKNQDKKNSSQNLKRSTPLQQSEEEEYAVKVTPSKKEFCLHGVSNCKSIKEPSAFQEFTVRQSAEHNILTLIYQSNKQRNIWYNLFQACCILLLTTISLLFKLLGISIKSVYRRLYLWCNHSNSINSSIHNKEKSITASSSSTATHNDKSNIKKTTFAHWDNQAKLHSEKSRNDASDWSIYMENCYHMHFSCSLLPTLFYHCLPFAIRPSEFDLLLWSWLTLNEILPEVAVIRLRQMLTWRRHYNTITSHCVLTRHIAHNSLEESDLTTEVLTQWKPSRWYVESEYVISLIICALVSLYIIYGML